MEHRIRNHGRLRYTPWRRSKTLKGVYEDGDLCSVMIQLIKAEEHNQSSYRKVDIFNKSKFMLFLQNQHVRWLIAGRYLLGLGELPESARFKKRILLTARLKKMRNSSQRRKETQPQR